MVIFLQRTFTSLVHAHAGRTLNHEPDRLRLIRNDEYLTTRMRRNYRLWKMLAVPIDESIIISY